jgi:FAD/FMN-containing dehydrogenase
MLGVVTSASFKLVPRPRQTATLVAEFATATAALAFCENVASSPLTPMSLELVSPNAKRFLRPAEAAVHPEDYTPPSSATRNMNWGVFVRAAGSDAVLARYRSNLGQTAGREITGAAEKSLWQRVGALDSEAVTRQPNAMVVQIAVTNTQVAAALDTIEKTATDYNFVPSLTGRMGAFVVVFSPMAVDPPSAMQYAGAASALRAALPRGAVAIVTRCPLEAKRHFDVWGTLTSDLASMRAIKQKLDPNGILNRGRFVV